MLCDMSDAMDAVFGRREDRPTHPDFWRLSEVILANDASHQDADSEDAARRAFRQRAGALADLNSVGYMARQRALRALGPDSELLVKGASLWMEGFLVGVAFQQAGGHQDG